MAHAYTHFIPLSGSRFTSLSILYLFYVVTLHAIHPRLLYCATGYGPRLLKPIQKPLPTFAPSITYEMSQPTNIWQIMFNCVPEFKSAEDYDLWSDKFADVLFLADFDAEGHIKKGERLVEGTEIEDGTETGSDGKEKPKVRKVTASEATKWEENDQRVMRMIRLRLGREPLVHVRTATTAREAWVALQQAYKPRGLSNDVYSLGLFFTTKMEEGGDMEEHLRKMVDIRNGISLNAHVSDTLFALALMSSMPPSYSSFIATFDPLDTSVIDSGRVQQRLLMEHQRRKQSEGPLALAARAYNQASGSRGRRPWQEADRSGDTCKYCKEKGHWLRECPKLKAKGSARGAAGAAGAANVAETTPAPTETANVATIGQVASITKVIDDDLEFVFVAEDRALAARTAEEKWIGDSGAGVHVVTNREFFQTYDATPGTLDGVGSQPIMGRGDVRLVMHGPEGDTRVTLRDAVHVPTLAYNLISLARVTGTQFETSLTDTLTIRNRETGRVVATGQRQANLYYVKATGVKVAKAYVTVSAREAHEALGHISADSIRQMTTGMIDGLRITGSIPNRFQCAECIQGKHARTAQPKKATREITEVGELIVSDVMGGGTKLPVGIGGIHYVVTFTDMRSRFTVCFYLKNKSEVLAAFKQFQIWFENQTGKKIKCIRSDLGGEYTSHAFREFCALLGIEVQNTAPYSPAQNGGAERLNRTLIDHVIAMLVGADLPRSIWPYAVAHFTWIKNRIPTRALSESITPYEIFLGTKPKFGHLVPFGQQVWVLDERPGRTKFDSRSRQFPFLGFSDDPGIIKYWNGQRVLTSRNVIFDNVAPKSHGVPMPAPTLPLEGEKWIPLDSEDWSMFELADGAQMPQDPNIADGDPNGRILAGGDADIPPETPDLGGDLGNDAEPIPSDNESNTGDSENGDGDPPPNIQDPEPTIRLSTRLRDKPRLNYKTLGTRGLEAARDEAYTVDEEDPKTYAEAMSSQNAEEWAKSMQKEYDQLVTKGVFRLEELPPGRTAIDCRWVLTAKRNVLREVLKWKSRIVVKGFSQRPGLDYNETHSSVVRPESLRLIIAIATGLGWEIDQMDVVGAFLNADLPETEVVYMRQPPGFDDGSGRYLRLVKALYGLKQAGRAWNERFNRFLTDKGWLRTKSDECVYVLRREGETVYLTLHVDDMLITGSCTKLKNIAKAEIMTEFECTDLGPVSKILGYEVHRDLTNRRTKMSQGEYIQNILTRFGMADANPVSTPLDPNVNLTRPDPNAKILKDIPYRELIGSLQYAATGTRPDIAFAVGLLSRFLDKPEQRHWTAAKRILRYLVGSRDLGIVFDGSVGSVCIVGFSDADFASCELTRRSISGYLFMIFGALIAWRSRQESLLALSTMDSEYAALSQSTREAIWLRSLLMELGFAQDSPTPIHCDNRAAIELSKDSKYHSRAKHIDIKHHHVRDHVRTEEIVVPYVRTGENVADQLTKALPRDHHHALITAFGMAS